MTWRAGRNVAARVQRLAGLAAGASARRTRRCAGALARRAGGGCATRLPRKLRPHICSLLPTPARDTALNHEPAELTQLRAIIASAGARLDVRVACEVAMGEHSLPVYAITLGSSSPEAPAVGFFGGVHGLERIGTQLVLAYLANLLARLRWDGVLQAQLRGLRLVFMPLVNPGGMALGTRANPSGVDLMRNSPVQAQEAVPMLLGGHRIGTALPWFRGHAGAPMQAESAALCEVVGRELLGRPFCIAIDCHSGFGMRDRVWFPHAHTCRPIDHLAEVHAFTALLDQSCPYHRYLVEPQSHQYCTHGDLWDHLYLGALQRPASVFLPLTLEMGSWLWIKKNPRQLLSRQGLFNPSAPHRQQRVLRRHLAWFDFVMRAASSHTAWLPAGTARETERRAGLARWYGAAPQCAETTSAAAWATARSRPGGSVPRGGD